MDFGFGEFFENLERSKTGKTSSPPSTYSFYRTNEEMEKHRQDKKARRAAFYKLIGQQDPKQHIKPERPVIDQYIADGKKVFQNLFLRMTKVTEDFVDNVDLKPIPKNFKITEDKYEHVELIQGLFDEEEELQKSQLKEKNLKKNQAIMTCISYLEKRSFPFNSSQDQTSFSLHKEEFFKNFNGWQFEKNRLLYFQKYKAFDIQQQHSEILDILKYEEKEIDQFKNIFLAYIPSGGGKSTMYKKYKSFVKMLDVDEFIKENLESFQLFQKFINQIDIPHEGIMTLWFKYKLDQLYQKDDFDDILLLFNHPNQFPNYFRRKYNEIILMPEKFNWDVRFFAENYFSLACVLGKHKTVLRYDQYLSYILEFFSMFFSPTRIRKIIKKKIYGYSPIIQPQPAINQLSDNTNEQAHSPANNNKRVNTWLDSFLESVETERKRIKTRKDGFIIV